MTSKEFMSRKVRLTEILPEIEQDLMKWNYDNFGYPSLANKMKSTLAQCGLRNLELGNTYLADRPTSNGNTIESDLDHIFAKVS